MEDLGRELHRFFLTPRMRAVRADLCGRLKAPVLHNDVYVYYIAALPNIVRIAHGSGIVCRSAAPEGGIDLSGPSVQVLRERNVALGRSSAVAAILKPIHGCVSFFWNPLNTTLFAFQRNALTRHAQMDDEVCRIVCIVELSLAKILDAGTMYWTTSDRNLAAAAVSTAHSRQMYETFPWTAVYAVQDVQGTREHRAAEFIAFRGDPSLDRTESIPWTVVTRVLVAQQHEQRARQLAPSITSVIRGLPGHAVFRREETLLKAEIDMLSVLRQLEESGLGAKWWGQLITDFAAPDDSLVCYVADKWFTSVELAQGFHGISHVTRVMFWVHALSTLQAVDVTARKAALCAAFIHDACRQSDEEDDIHGQDAAREYEGFLRQKVGRSHAQASIDAVAYHCLPDESCPTQGLVWQLLKDADAIDRGRFGPPGVGTRGCDTRHLRLTALNDGRRLNVQMALMGWCLAHMTSHVRWTDNTYEDIKQVLLNGTTALLKWGQNLDAQQNRLARELLEALI